MPKNANADKKNRHKDKLEPAINNDQLGENAGEGRIIQGKQKEKKR